jgi:hypothetical protein
MSIPFPSGSGGGEGGSGAPRRATGIPLRSDGRHRRAFLRRMNSTFEGLRPTVGLRRPGEDSFASAEADVRRASALEGRFQSAPRPSVDDRPARRMNSASRGLWPVVGLRRPGKRSLRRRRPTPGAERLRRPISIGTKAFGWWVACADREKILLRRRRPTLGAERLERPISIGVKGLRLVGRPVRRMNSASRGLWPVVGLRRPGKAPFASAEADAWRGAPLKADFNRRQRPSAGESPAPTWKSTFCVGGGRRLARSVLRGRFQSASRGLWPVVGLRRPGKAPFASAEADVRRASA